MLVKLRSGFETPDAGILQGAIVVTLKTFIEGMKYVFVCLRVCLCVLVYGAVELCGSVSGVGVDSCLLCVLFGCHKRPPSLSFITGIESFFSSHG